jgi:hypothetical protein
MATVSTTAPDGSVHPPYIVQRQAHAVTFRPDGTQGGEYTVHIRHRNGVQTQFKVPEEHYSAENVHAMAMHQVRSVQAVDQLPGNMPTQAPPTQAQ